MRKTGTKKSIKKNNFSISNFGKVANSFGYERNSFNGVVEPGITKEAFMNTTTTPAQFYSPELTPETWLLPKSRLEILKWVRVFFNLEPYIQSILVMHAQYPICDFTLQYKDKDTTDFFNRKLFNNPEFSWIDFLEQLSLSYWKFGEACLTSDTKIKLLDGSIKSIGDLYKEGAKDFWVYSIDEKGNIVPGKADEVVLTRKDAELVKVTLDNGEYFRCTPDHLIMMRDGSYKEAKDLNNGDALMPLYFKDSYAYYNKNHSKHKYELVYNPSIGKDGIANGKWFFTHRLISLFVNGDSTGKVVHHINFNNKDNTPENLKVLSYSEHRKIHAKEYTEEELNNFHNKTKENYEKPGYREMMGEAIKRGMTPRVRKSISEKSKEFWSNPENREKARARSKGRKHTPETIEKLRKIAKERYLKNPEEVLTRLAKATVAAAKVNTGRIVSEDTKNRLREKNTQFYNTEEGKKLQSIRARNYWDSIENEYKNHKVSLVEYCGKEDVFDIHSSGDYHNFAIVTGEGSGIFVHNCVWGDWNPVQGTWNNFVLVDPSLVDYHENPLTGKIVMELIPTTELKQVVATSLKEGRSDLPAEYIQCVQENQQIPLDAEGTEPNYITGKKYSPPKAFMFVRKTDPGAVRGTPILQCARYSTKIKLLDGSIKSIGDLYKEGAKDFWVYSIDEKGNIVPGKATKVIYSGKKLTYDITLDNGEVLGFTSDHPFLMRDGSWKEVKDLKPGDSLMPLYTKDAKIGNGMYEQVFNPATDAWEFTHRLVELPGKFKGCVIHHKNFNKKDNRPENLQVTSFKEHVALHKKLLEENKDKRIAGLRRYMKSDKFIANCKKQSENASKFIKELWKTEDYRKKQAANKQSRVEGIRAVYNKESFKESRKKGIANYLISKYQKDTLYNDLVSLNSGNGYLIIDGGKAKSRYYKNMVKHLGLDLLIISKNNKTIFYTKDYDISKVLKSAEIGSTHSYVNTILERVTDLFNSNVDFILLDNEEFGIKSTSTSKHISKFLKPRFDVGVSRLGYFGYTIIYKKDAEEVVDLFKRSSALGDYNNMPTNSNWKEYLPLLNELHYTFDCSTKILPYNLSTFRGLKAYILRNNLPISISKSGDTIELSRVWNHKVVSVTPSKVEDVYDIESVDGTHNFAVACEDGSGVFVHNCLFKTLIYQDKIRLAQIAIADRFHLPLEIWSIGSYTGDPKTSLIPDDATLDEFRDLIQQATMQPPFSIYVPPYVKYEAVGVNGKLLSVYEDLGYVENQILVGLGVNKNLITGQGPSFSSAKQVSLYKLIKMYKIFRQKLEAFIKRYILLPIARANDLKDEFGNYIIPDIVWSESLQPEQDKEIFDSLSKLWDKGIISTLTLMENFMKPLDYNLEQKRLNSEKGTVFDKGNDRLGNKATRDDLKPSKPTTPSSGDRATEDGGGYDGSENDDKSYLEPPLSGGGEEAPEAPDIPEESTSEISE